MDGRTLLREEPRVEYSLDHGLMSPRPRLISRVARGDGPRLLRLRGVDVERWKLVDVHSQWGEFRG